MQDVTGKSLETDGAKGIIECMHSQVLITPFLYGDQEMVEQR
jgi:hypothetical protein